MSVVSFKVSGQFTSVNITTGKDYFRDFLTRQVNNHTITIKTLRTDNSTWSPAPDPTLTTSGCSGYSGLIMVAANVLSTSQINTLEITPTTIGDFADFTNGCSAADLVQITKYIQGLRAFNSWHKVAADVDNNNVITNNDKIVLQNLILNNTNDFGPNGRKSWSWVPNLDVGAFINSPFSNVYGDPYTPHIYFSNLSRNQIINASANYFKLHAIKNGDIISIDGLGSGHNSWICGAGAYLHSNNTESRSYGQGYLGSTRLSTGDRVQLAVVLDQTPDSLGSLQFALKLPSNLGEIKQISFQGGLNSKWHYNRESGRLTVLCFYDIPGQHIRYTPGDIMNIEIGVTRDADISNIVGWVDNFNEVTKFSGDIFDTDFNLEIRNIIRSTFDIDILSTPNVEAIINSPVSESANIRITDLSGRVLESRSFYLKEGLNKYESNLNLQAGMYIFSVFSIGDSPKSIKFIR